MHESSSLGLFGWLKEFIEEGTRLSLKTKCSLNVQELNRRSMEVYMDDMLKKNMEVVSHVVGLEDAFASREGALSS